MEWFFVVSMTLVGLLLGSFANVVIWRLPRGESVVTPGSHCTACGAPIAWYDNVPVASYLVLRGKCRSCGAAISVRYPLVEAASGVLFAVAAIGYGASARAVFAAVLFWGLAVLSLIDIEHYRLPNPLVAFLAVVGLAGAAASQVLGQPIVPLVGVAASGLLSEPLAAALAGAVAAGGFSLIVAEGYARLRHRQGFGMGDVKLLGVLGLFLGMYAFMALVVGSVIGSGYAVVRSLASGNRLGKMRLPFGAFLAAGALVCVWVGEPVWHWYARVAGLS